MKGLELTRKIPVPVLQALLNFFTAVQYLPDNRYVHVETHSGLVLIVAWAHHLLCLTVCVKAKVDGEVSIVRFGN